MPHTLLAILSLTALLGCARGASAQSIPSPYRYLELRHSVGFFGGYLLTAPGIGIVDEKVELGAQPGPLAGVRYSLRFAGPASGEIMLAGVRTTRTVFVSGGPDNPPRPAGETDVSLVLADAGIVFHLTGARSWRGFAPFVVGSGGIMTEVQGTSELEEAIPTTARFQPGPALALGIGVGTDWFPTERLSIRAEARDRLWKIEAPQDLRPAGANVSEWTNNVSFSLGAAIHF